MTEAFFVSVIGIAAGVLVLSSFVPQIIKSYKTKLMKDISPLLMTLIIIGMSLWIVYGFMVEDLVIVGANVVGVGFNATLLTMKLRYDGNKKRN